MAGINHIFSSQQCGSDGQAQSCLTLVIGLQTVTPSQWAYINITIKLYQYIMMIQLMILHGHHVQLLVYDESYWWACCLGWTKTVTRSTLQSELHPSMMNGAATGTRVSTSIPYRLISNIYIEVSHHLVRNLVGQNVSSCGCGHINDNCVWWSQRTSRS